MLEHKHELERLEAVLDAAGAGAAVLVEGVAGAGKTALLSAASAAAEERGMRVLRGRAGEYERNFGFGVVRQCLEPGAGAHQREAARGRVRRRGGSCARSAGG